MQHTETHTGLTDISGATIGPTQVPATTYSTAAALGPTYSGTPGTIATSGFPPPSWPAQWTQPLAGSSNMLPLSTTPALALPPMAFQVPNNQIGAPWAPPPAWAPQQVPPPTSTTHPGLGLAATTTSALPPYHPSHPPASTTHLTGFYPPAPPAMGPTASAHFTFFTLPTLCGYMNLAPQHLQYMPQFLPRLATLKINEASGFLRHEINCLKREGDNGHFFHAFQFPASLARDLSKRIYSFGGDTHTLRTEWHKGLGPGIAMTRNWEEVAAANSSLASLDEYGSHIHLGRTDIARLQAPVPQPPQDYQGFINFLIRYARLLSRWLTPNCNWYTIVAAVLTVTQSLNEQTQNPTEWYYQQGPFILWMLIRRAQTFFAETRTDPTLGTHGPVILTNDPHGYARDLIRDASSIPPGELPASFLLLHAKSQSGRHYQPTGQTPGIPPAPAQGLQPHQPRGGQPRQQYPGPRIRTGQPPQEVLHRNPTPSGPLIQFFATLQQSNSPVSRRTRDLLPAAGLTVPEAQVMLGLVPDDCFNYHARGSCSSRGCRRQHNPRPITPANAQQLLSRLQPLLTNAPPRGARPLAIMPAGQP
jgi:hypothetical protein